MRKAILYALCGLLFVACNHFSGYHHQLKEIETVIESYPDSAWTLLSRLPATLLSDGEERAMYNLLLTEAKYKLYKSFNDDSLISYSVDHYEKNGNLIKLAVAYYYQGAVYRELNDIDKAILFLKKAEELAEKNDDELLKNKIYETLYNINSKYNNFSLARKYADLLLKSSLKMDSLGIAARAFGYISNVFMDTGNKDSASYYMRQGINMLEKCDAQTKGHLMANYASILVSNKQYAEAKEYIDKAMQFSSLPIEHILLGIIYENMNDTLQARINYEKATTFNDPSYSVPAYQYLSRLYYKNRDYKLALSMWAKGDNLNFSYQENKYKTQLAEIQGRYDNAALENVLTEQKNRWLSIAVIALTAFAVALLGILYFRKRNETYKGIINKNIEQIYQKEQKIKLLESQGQEFEHEVETLREQVEKMKQSTIQNLGKGKTVYDAVKDKGRLVDFSKDKEQAFVDYYAFTFSEQYHAMIAPYKSPTLRHTTYLVMRQMGLDDKTIRNLLNVSDSTIRNYRYRLQK